MVPVAVDQVMTSFAGSVADIFHRLENAWMLDMEAELKTFQLEVQR